MSDYENVYTEKEGIAAMLTRIDTAISEIKALVKEQKVNSFCGQEKAESYLIYKLEKENKLADEAFTMLHCLNRLHALIDKHFGD